MDLPCTQTDPEIFFPESRERSFRYKIYMAKMACGRCPAREWCLDIAMQDSSLVGIWGGTTHDERWLGKEFSEGALAPYCKNGHKLTEDNQKLFLNWRGVMVSRCTVCVRNAAAARRRNRMLGPQSSLE